MSFLTSPAADGERDKSWGLCRLEGEQSGGSERKCPTMMSMTEIKVRTAWKQAFSLTKEGGEVGNQGMEGR